MSAKAISVSAYWAWAIREGHKRVENRNWRTPHRGPLLIHAQRSDEHDERAKLFIIQMLGEHALPSEKEIAEMRGCLVARVDLIDCTEHPSCDSDPWAWGPICWQLANVRPLPNVPCRGLPGLFSAPYDETP